MKNCFVIIMLLEFVFSVSAQTNKVPQVTAKVEKLVRVNKKDWITFEVDLKFELKNISNEKIFLLKNEFNFYGIEVFRHSTKDNSLESVLRNQHPPSFSGNVKWIKVGEEIMVSGIKSDYLISLKPDESIYYEKNYTFGFPTEKYKHLSSSLSWDEVSNEKELFLKFDTNVWENEIRTKNISSKKFPTMLAKKIKNQGVFWFENIISEPIPIDLSSAVVKIESQL